MTDENEYYGTDTPKKWWRTCRCGHKVKPGPACGCTFCENCGLHHGCNGAITDWSVFKNKKKEEKMTGIMYPFDLSQLPSPKYPVDYFIKIASPQQERNNIYSDIVVTNNGVYEAIEMNNTYFNTYAYLELVPCTTF